MEQGHYVDIELSNEGGKHWNIRIDELALSVIITQAVAAVETGDMTGLTKILSLTGLLGGAES